MNIRYQFSDAQICYNLILLLQINTLKLQNKTPVIIPVSSSQFGLQYAIVNQFKTLFEVGYNQVSENFEFTHFSLEC